MRAEFLGGARTVTGSATLLEKGSTKGLVDCGMFQGGKEFEERNRSVQAYHIFYFVDPCPHWTQGKVLDPTWFRGWGEGLSG